MFRDIHTEAVVFTIDEAEREVLSGSPDFAAENYIDVPGRSLFAFDQPSSADLIPIHRFLNTATGGHVYRSDTVLPAEYFLAEGVKFYACADTFAGVAHTGAITPYVRTPCVHIVQEGLELL